MKRFFLFLICLSISTVNMAQEIEFTPNHSIGVRGGVAISNLFSYYGYNYRTSFQGGVVGNIHLEGKSYLLAEILYSIEGAKMADEKLAFYNLLLPLLYKREITNWLTLEGGPQVSIMLGNNFEFNPAFRRGWINATVGFSTFVTDRNYISFRYAKGLIPIISKNFSSTFAITCGNNF